MLLDIMFSVSDRMPRASSDNVALDPLIVLLKQGVMLFAAFFGLAIKNASLAESLVATVQFTSAKQAARACDEALQSSGMLQRFPSGLWCH